MVTIQNALVRGFGKTPNGTPSGQDFYIEGGSGGGGGVTAQEYVVSGNTHTTPAVGTLVGWNSPAASPKTENIPTSTGSLGIIIITDYYGNAAQYPISVVPASGSIVQGPTSLAVDFGSMTLLDTDMGWSVINYLVVSQGTSGNVPSNALLAEDGTPLLAEDGSYLLSE